MDFFCILCMLASTTAQWDVTTILSPSLPAAVYSAAIGSYNDSFYILGASFTEYRISTNVFNDRGSEYNPFDVQSSSSQFYTQTMDTLYWIRLNTIYSYDYRTSSFDQIAQSPIDHGLNDQGYACLTSYNDLLFVLGSFWCYYGYNPCFNISSQEWLQVEDNLKCRRDLACAIDPIRGTVYTIGGHSDQGGWLNTVETLIIGSNVTQASWNYSAYTLLDAGSWGKRAIYIDIDDSILVILNDIQRIDCQTGEVSWMADLEYAAYNSALGFVDHVLYIFGGYNGSHTVDTWQRVTNPFILGSYAPSADPSRNPTIEPTVEPTFIPSNDPSTYPSTDPSTYPSRNPTKAPTNGPSQMPSKYPTKPPSRDPSLGPTGAPSKAPTKSPSTNPSNNPSIFPSEYPTKEPTSSPIPPDAVVTNYEISIDINDCDTGDDDDDDNGNTAAGCQVDEEALQVVIAAALSVESSTTLHVGIMNIGYVNNELVVQLSVTTSADNVLQSDVINDHIEKEIKDNKIKELGNVNTEQKDDQFNDIQQDDIIDMRMLLRYVQNPLVIVILCGALIGCVCCIKYIKLQQKVVHLERMMSVSSDAYVPRNHTSDNTTDACIMKPKDDGITAAGDAGILVTSKEAEAGILVEPKEAEAGEDSDTSDEELYDDNNGAGAGGDDVTAGGPSGACAPNIELMADAKRGNGAKEVNDDQISSYVLCTPSGGSGGEQALPNDVLINDPQSKEQGGGGSGSINKEE